MSAYSKLTSKGAVTVKTPFPRPSVQSTSILGVFGFSFTTISNIVVLAQAPAVGVKVYVWVAVFEIAGLHVPVIAGEFVELVERAGIISPEQYGPTALKVGIIFGLTLISPDTLLVILQPLVLETTT